MSNYHTKIQEVIQWKNIRQLVHFTRIANLRSIIEYGILSRQEIEKREIKVEFNDPLRLDAWPNTSSISITEKNIYLFPKFVERSKTNENNWFDILINPSILTEKECIFCDTNASNHKFNGLRNDSNSLKTPEAFKGMFEDYVIRTDFGKGTPRNKKDDNLTTDPQAEICVYGVIEKKYFLNLNEIKEKIK
jgi:hypothetical protein